MDSTAAERTIAATLGLTQTVLGSVSDTIVRPLDGGAPGDGAARGERLPRIAIDGDSADASASDLVTRGELGRGGMGVVRLAQQRSLRRDVAVKTGLGRDANLFAALVREARLMGSLEHPNLVPVHALGIDRAGAPVLVMKRIDGVSWRTLLDDPDHDGWQSLLVGHEDRLRANVELLTQVCRALSFVHDRGVVHRDLKPANVMIGRFGEVYLLDWGVALRLSEAASEPAGIVGTPGYLAPEMARADPSLIDARTDVYLLGGTLYEILAGRMPHDAPTPMAALVSALLGEAPALPPATPAELAALVRHAMASEREERVASADEFLAGLKRFLASREADAIVLDARSAVSRATDALAATGPGSSDAYRALVEARFGFITARRVRPHDDAIRRELDQCIVMLVEREIALRSPAGAHTLLGELDLPPDALVTRIAALEREIEAERAAVGALHDARRNADTSVALRAMQRALTWTAVVSVPVLTFIAWDQQAHSRNTPISWAVAGNLAALAAAFLALYLGRRMVLANAATRRVAGFVAMLPVTLCVCNFVSFAVGRTLDEAAVTTSPAILCLCAVGALTVLRDLWPAVVALMLVLAALLVLPGAANVISLVAIPAFIVLLARAIRREAERSRVSDDRDASLR